MFVTDSTWRIPTLVALLIFAFSCAVFAANDEEAERIERQRCANEPCVATSYGPFSGYFVVDTGASISAAFGAARFHEFPDPQWRFGELEGRFAVGSGSLPLVENISVTTFGNKSRRTRLLLMEKMVRSPPDKWIDGILGLPDVRDLILRFDHQNGLVAKLDSKWQASEKMALVKMEPKGEVDLRIPIEIAPTEIVPAIVDTGCRPFLLLRRSALVYQQRLGNAVVANRVNGSTAVEIREVQTFILKSVRICGFEFRNVQVQESNFNAIGMGCFSHFDMVLDFPKNEMWLTPLSDDWPKQVPPDASGLVLGFLDNNVLSLLRIQPDSVASKSELRVDDQILLFDGKEPRDLSMFEIHQRQTQAGTVLPLRIRRGDREIDILLPLSYSFAYPPKWSEEKNVLDEFGEFLEKDKTRPESKPAVPNPIKVDSQ